MSLLAVLPAAPSLSTGDIIAMTTVALGIGAWIWREVAGLMRDGARRAGVDAVVKVQIEGFTAALDRLTDEQKRLSQQYAEHEKECAEFRGEISGDIRRHADAAEKSERDLQYVKAQISHMTPRADTFTQIMPRED